VVADEVVVAVHLGVRPGGYMLVGAHMEMIPAVGYIELLALFRMVFSVVCFLSG